MNSDDSLFYPVWLVYDDLVLKFWSTTVPPPILLSLSLPLHLSLSLSLKFCCHTSKKKYLPNNCPEAYLRLKHF